MRNKKTAELLDRLREAHRSLANARRDLQQALSEADIDAPNGLMSRAFLRGKLEHLGTCMDRFDALREADSILGIPPEDIAVACGDNVDEFWALFDAYRAAEDE